MAPEVHDSDDEIEDAAPHYDIFGDDLPSASSESRENLASSNDEEKATEGELTEDDIIIFLENEEAKANAKSSSQEVRDHHAPHLEMQFPSDDAAYKFYNEYSSICGFSIAKAGNYHGRKSGNTGHTRVTFVCNRAGKPVDEETLEKRRKQKQLRKQERTGVVPAENSRRTRRNKIEHTGCLAKMVVSIKNGNWVVISLHLEHNHELSPPQETKFLRSHKSMTEDEQLFIRTFASVKLPPRKIMSIMSYLRGGDVPYTKKHVSNVQTAIRNECKLNDMTHVLDYFHKRKEDDPRFYYNFKLGAGKKVLSLFWSDGNSRRMYELYGDCVSFDTTYKTNRYNLPFAPFVGVTGHGHTCLFACAII
ncbi:hypothetical protein ACQ4PT_062066 [Festuca glaucescens]